MSDNVGIVEGKIVEFNNNISHSQEPMPDVYSDQDSSLPQIPVVILAGGKGTRLQEETKGVIPKAMVEIDGHPIIQHVMHIYADQGFKEFYIAGGHLIQDINDWCIRLSGFFDRLGWKVNVVFTGEETQTGGRLGQIMDLIGDQRLIFMTYADGLADVNLMALLDHHRYVAADVTLSAVHPPSRFGNLTIRNGMAETFGEKSALSTEWINGGFYVIDPCVRPLILGDVCRWEYDVLPAMALQNRLGAYRHPGYFQMMDTPRDRKELEKSSGENAPWLRWHRR